MVKNCPSCAAAMRVSDESLVSGSAMIQCPSCDHMFFVRAPDSAGGDSNHRTAPAPIQAPKPAKTAPQQRPTGRFNTQGAGRAAAPAPAPAPFTQPERTGQFDLFGVPQPRGSTAGGLPAQLPPQQRKPRVTTSLPDPVAFDIPKTTTRADLAPSGDDDPFAAAQALLGGDTRAFDEMGMADDSSFSDDFDIAGGAVFDPDAEAPSIGAPAGDSAPSAGSGTTDESTLLNLALMASGLDEPAAAEARKSGNYVLAEYYEKRVQEEVAKRQPKIVGLDVDEDSAKRLELAAEGGGSWVGAVLAIVLACIGFMGFVAYKNDGVVDLKDMGQMLAVAFQGEAYQPRHVQTIRVFEVDERIVEERVSGTIDTEPADLEPVDISTGYYRTESGVEMLLIEGAVLNNTATDYFRSIEVSVELIDADGEAVMSVMVPAGDTLAQPELEAAVDDAGRDAAYLELSARARELEIPPSYRAEFTAVFFTPAGLLPASTSYVVRTAHARLRTPETCWSDASFVAGQID